MGIKNLKGRTFGRLEVLEDSGKRKLGNVLWYCLCECGNETLVRSSSLLRGHTKSCGCLHAEHAAARLYARPIQKKGCLSTRWKGGKFTNTQGYVAIYSPDHPNKDCRGYVREHILVIEKLLGRYLEPGETVHHENEIKDDNRLRNLKLFATPGAHIIHHAAIRSRVARYEEKGVKYHE